MIHFIYLIGFAAFVAVAFAIFSTGDTKARILHGLKTFGQFVLVSMVLAWILYFLPW
jgi:hypothetical protein